MIDINSITIKNNAMFNIVMRRPNLCKMCLERILDKNITSISYPDSEHTLDFDLQSKSVRLDIFCEDENTTYNIELQNGIYEDLPRRSRYYQDMIDIDQFDKGSEYSELKNGIVIFICTFDWFGEGRHLYTFENMCLQDHSINLQDGTTKIFLNTKGTLDDIPKPLKNFLDYIDSGKITDEYTRELDEAIIDVRKDKKWRKKIMTVEQLIKDEAKLAQKKGEEIGEARGLKKGLEQGQKRLNTLYSFLIRDNRIDELKDAITNPNLQEELFAEYGIR